MALQPTMPSSLSETQNLNATSWLTALVGKKGIPYSDLAS